MAPPDRLWPFWSILLLVLVAAVAVRLYALDREQLGFDGFLSVGLAREQWPLSFNFHLRDPHPPLYYLSLRGWLALSGTTFETARWLSVASGVVSVAILGRMARDLAGPLSGILAALLLTLAPAHVSISASVRDFAPGLALSLFALWLYPVRRSQDPFGRKRIVVLILITGAAVLTWYFHFVILAMQTTALLFQTHRRDIWLGLCGGLLLAVPWLVLTLPHLLPQFLNVEVRGLETIPIGAFAHLVYEASGVWPGLPWQSGLWIFIGLILLSWLALARARLAQPLYFYFGKLARLDDDILGCNALVGARELGALRFACPAVPPVRTGDEHRLCAT